MRPLDFLEPLPVYAPGTPVREALRWLNADVPVAFASEHGWRIVRPADSACAPSTRQLCDLPSDELATIDVEAEVDVESLGGYEVWGATKEQRLVGRLERCRVMGALVGVAREDAMHAVARVTRVEVMPSLLHDLSNALQIASVAEMGAASEASSAIQHARSLVRHMRSLYVGEQIPPREFAVAAMLRTIEPSLKAAARPARLEMVGEPTGSLHARRWRVEAMLINLVMNASNHASQIRITASDQDGNVSLVIEDDGPGIERLAAVPPRTKGMRGVGLRSVKHQILSMRGHWEVSRSEMGGTRVSVLLPRSS